MDVDPHRVREIRENRDISMNDASLIAHKEIADRLITEVENNFNFDTRGYLSEEERIQRLAQVLRWLVERA